MASRPYLWEDHSDVFVVVCNEGGQYLTYNTDEHGFPNPKGLWQHGSLDVAMVGDSNAVGECVPQADSIAGQLRTKFPSTITLGAGGHGPMFSLASIREYLRYRQAQAGALDLLRIAHPAISRPGEPLPISCFATSTIPTFRKS